MLILNNPAFERQIVDILIQEYQFEEPREGIHASDLIYCLTKSFWNKVDYLPPTIEDVMRFSIGLGLERVIIQFTASRRVPLEKDGIILSPDFILDKVHAELKTTRWGVGKTSPTWFKQIMAYAYVVETLFFNLAVLHVIPAVLKGYALVFTEEELRENWYWMLHRKEILDRALRTDDPPKAFQYNEDWECNGCRYKLRCDLEASQRRLLPDNVVPMIGGP